MLAGGSSYKTRRYKSPISFSEDYGSQWGQSPAVLKPLGCYSFFVALLSVFRPLPAPAGDLSRATQQVFLQRGHVQMNLRLGRTLAVCGVSVGSMAVAGMTIGNVACLAINGQTILPILFGGISDCDRGGVTVGFPIGLAVALRAVGPLAAAPFVLPFVWPLPFA